MHNILDYISNIFYPAAVKSLLSLAAMVLAKHPFHDSTLQASCIYVYNTREHHVMMLYALIGIFFCQNHFSSIDWCKLQSFNLHIWSIHAYYTEMCMGPHNIYTYIY